MGLALAPVVECDTLIVTVRVGTLGSGAVTTTETGWGVGVGVTCAVVIVTWPLAASLPPNVTFAEPECSATEGSTVIERFPPVRTVAA